MTDSDDNSSDSSNDFAGITPKDDLSASFFSIKPAVKSNLVDSKSEDESSDEDDFTNVSDNIGIELFSEVVKNLEASQKTHVIDQKSQNPKDDSLQGVKAIKTDKRNKDISDEIKAVLLQGESSAFYEDDEDADEEEKKEDVKRPVDYMIPKEGINITLPGTAIFKKKPGKKETDLAAILRKKLKANQILVEKTARLGWLAYGFYLNRQANEPEIMATVTSLIPKNSYPKNNFDVTYLTKFTKWFKQLFTLEATDNNVIINKETLLKRIADKKIYNYRELVILYVATLRGIGLHCRLIVSLHPPLVKSFNELLPKTNTVKKTDQVKDEPKETKIEVKSSKKDKNTNSKDNKKTSNKKDAINKIANTVIQNSESARKEANIEAKKKAAQILRSYSYNKKSKDKLKCIEPDQNSVSTSKDVASTSTSLKDTDIKIFPKHLRSGKAYNVALQATKQSDVQGNLKTKSKRKNSKTHSQRSSGYFSSEEEDDDDDNDDEDGDEEDKEEVEGRAKLKRNNTKTAVNSRKEKNKQKDEESTDDEKADNNKPKRHVWTEIYVESKGSWICTNVVTESVDCVAEVYKNASKPVLYVIAYNAERSIKDVTRRYCPQWLSVTRKQRIDEKWWTETLSYWLERETAMSKQEDELLLQKELAQPLPKTVSDCKGHPLYVLTRHLLKYEALYPPDCVPLGHLKTGEAIYSRYCVHTLRSRETWIRKARVVKPKQEPYKIVKALPKYDKLSGMKIKDSALELFGEWQTTEYVPPEAKNGIVPRNEYGSVDLFKECMLPKGTVHINLPGLNRIARKLNIDCAPAVVGFNFKSIGAVPAIEGYVVCAEYEDTLREAWEAEQAEASRRAAEKKEKRIYGNWKRLIKGLLIREKLSQKYEFQDEPKADKSNKRSKQRKGAVKKMRQ